MESSIQTLALPLINKYSRQFFNQTVNQIDVRFLYDSGAKMPVWCSSVTKFMEVFTDASRLKESCMISGFGKGRENADVYMIPCFEIRDGDIRYQIERLVIAILPKPYMGCDFLISETMFAKIDTFSYRMRKRELHLMFEDRPYRCTARKLKGEILDISVWSQDE